MYCVLNNSTKANLLRILIEFEIKIDFSDFGFNVVGPVYKLGVAYITCLNESIIIGYLIYFFIATTHLNAFNKVPHSKSPFSLIAP